MTMMTMALIRRPTFVTDDDDDDATGPTAAKQTRSTTTVASECADTLINICKLHINVLNTSSSEYEN